MARYLVKSDLEALVGSTRVIQLFDDDCDGTLGVGETAVLTTFLDRAEAEADGHLLRAFNNDAITALAGADPAFKSHVAWVALAFAAERRGEFLGDSGACIYQAQYDRAIRYFSDLSKNKKRSKGEAVAGYSATGGGTLQPTLSTDEARFVFAPDNDNPTGHGGF